MRKEQVDPRPDPEELPPDQPIDAQGPRSGTRFGDQNLFEDERSDRESGRPVQLDNEEDRPRTGRLGAEPGLGGRRQQGGRDRRSRGGEPPKR